MKRRTRKLAERRKKREARKANQFQSLGRSDYAKKVKDGQMYGPMQRKEHINRIVSESAQVR